MDWQAMREEFPITRNYNYQNHAGVAPLSRRAAEAAREYLQHAEENAYIGTCFVNLSDTYAGSNKGAGYDGKNIASWRFDKKPQLKASVKAKSLCMIPSRFAIEMCRRGWILRNEIVWHKPNAMPSSVKDRFTHDFELHWLWRGTSGLRRMKVAEFSAGFIKSLLGLAGLGLLGGTHDFINHAV